MAKAMKCDICGKYFDKTKERRKQTIKHFKKWNQWRKHCLNGVLYKFLVLLGITKSPTFALFLTDDECE